MEANPNRDQPPREIVPYHPSQIRIEKSGGKKTASMFCATRKSSAGGRGKSAGAEAAAASVDEDGGPVRGPKEDLSSTTTSDIGTMSSINVSSFAPTDESDFSDNLSVVSDISDLSVMSLNHSFTLPSLIGAASTFGAVPRRDGGHNQSTLSLTSLKGRPKEQAGQPFNSLLPGVHGRPRNYASSLRSCGSFTAAAARSGVSGERRVKQLSKKLAILQTEKDAYQKQANLTSSHKTELAHLREENFQLRRENVNLRSKVDSLQNYQKSMLFYDPSGSNGQKAPENVLSEAKTDDGKVYEFRAQLRRAHDEIYRLQTCETKSRLELKSKSNELEGLKARTAKLSEETVALKTENKSLNDKLREFEFSSSSLSDEKKFSENKLSLLRSDLESLKESQEWYKKQLSVAQDQRSETQKELMKFQKELSAKNIQLVELKAELESHRTLLDAEKQKSTSAKEDFTMKLKRIENEMQEQESALDQIQAEKDAIIGGLAARINSSESDFKSIGGLSENIMKLERDMNILNERFEKKEAAFQAVSGEKLALNKILAELKGQMEVMRKEKEVLTTEVEDSKEMIVNLNEMLEEKEVESKNASKKIQEMKEKLEYERENKNELRSTLDATMSDLARQEASQDQLTSKFSALEKKVEELELELLDQHQSLDDSKAANENLKMELSEKEAMMQRLIDEAKVVVENKNQACAQNQELNSYLEEAKNEISTLRSQIGVLSGELDEYHSQSPEPGVQELKEENLELKQKILHLEQFENEVSELKHELESLSESKSVINEKLLEAEKAYYEEVEHLRRLIVQRDEMIDAMKADLEAVENDLGSTKQLLDAHTEDKERTTSEQVRRMEDLEFALESFEATKKELVEKTNALVEADDQNRILAEENENLVGQFQKTLIRVDILENENGRLKASLEENLAGEEEVKELHSHRIARLESFIAEYEEEIEELSSAKGQLQNQIIALEDQNGKLQSEFLLNESLREQIVQLQRDLKNDTSLRQELVKTVESAKASLGDEISSLEAGLKEEKDAHSRSKETVLKLEHENTELQQEVNALQMRYDDAIADLAKMELDSRRKVEHAAPARNLDASQRSNDPDFSGMERQLRELQHILEEKNRSICSLEDHIGTLKFHLQQKTSELEDTKQVMSMNAEKHEANMAQMREIQESLRVELAGNSHALDSLSEERNSYKNQVQDMNLALKNSLEHIKQLRSQASPHSSSSPLLDDSALTDLFQKSSGSPGRNISNLHSCLASLKAEMAILQSKLAPSSSGAGSRENSPDWGQEQGQGHGVPSPERVRTKASEERTN